MNRSKLFSVVMLLFASILLGNHPTFAQTKKTKPKVTYYSVKAGTVMRVRLDNDMSSKTAFVGQTFQNTTVDPIYSSGGVLLIPQGSMMLGRVTAVQAAQKDGRPGTIDVTYTSITLPNDRKVAISGSLTESDSGEKNTVDNEGTVSGKTTKRRGLKFIGGGAAGGAVIGGIAGGGTGAAIGAGVGALAGLIGKEVKKGHEAEVSAGTQYGVYLNRAFSLPKYRATTN